MSNKPPLIVILGPTASGKSDLAVEIALHFDGEVISADSRQVYRGLDIATGKITTEEMKDVPHHLLDVAEPSVRFSVADYKELADKAVFDILKRSKLPILTGGTGYYIQAVVDDFSSPEVPPDHELRKKLEGKDPSKLLEILRVLDPRRAQSIEQENPRRLIRAIEIATRLGKVPKVEKHERFRALLIGLTLPEEELRERIHKRTISRLENGMIEEAQNLILNGVSIERLRELGLEYLHLADYIEGLIDREELQRRIERDDWRYARRQMRWFKRDKRIAWHHPSEREEILEKMEWFLGGR